MWGVLVAILGGFCVALLFAPLMILLSSLTAHILAPAFGLSIPSDRPSPADARFAGLLLFLQLSMVYFAKALAWVGEPLARANLGSIVPLQFCWTPKRVAEKLERWRSMLVCRWLDEDPIAGSAACRMRELLRESLWRDIFGLIPVSFAVLLLGLWFAARQLQWEWLEQRYLNIPLWLLLPAIGAVADYLEDVGQLSYLRRHASKEGKPLGIFAVGGAFVMALIKLVTISTAVVTVVSAMAYGTWQIALLGESTGWRGMFVLIISSGVVLAIGSLLLGALVYSIFGTKKRNCPP